MPEICFSSHLCEVSDIVGDDANLVNAFRRSNGLQENDRLTPCRAYTLNFDDPLAQALVQQFNSMPLKDREAVSWCAATFGDDTNGIAAFCETNLKKERLQETGGLVGAASAAAKARLNGFQSALLEYQEALLALQERKQITVKGVPITSFGAEKRVREAYQALEGKFEAELSLYVNRPDRAKNKSNALTNADRGLLLANRSAGGKADHRLFVADTVQAGKIRWFGGFLRGVGQGAMLLDAFLRYSDVKTAHSNGRDWVRESVKQTAGFSFAAVFGGAAGNFVIKQGTATGGYLLTRVGSRVGGQLAIRAGMIGATGLIGAGPVGWAILGVVVCAGLYAGLTIGERADKIGQKSAGMIYDWAWAK